MLGAHFVWRPLGDLYESVRTGTSGFSRLYGEQFFDWLNTHPEDGAVFNDAMTSGWVRRLPAVLAAYDFSCFERIVDVGGGHGALLAGILSAIPKVRGVLYDPPNVVAGAEALRARRSRRAARLSETISLSPSCRWRRIHPQSRHTRLGISRAPATGSEFVADSPLEEAGFEPSVPPRNGSSLRRRNWLRS
jgi:hypothetical protein